MSPGIILSLSAAVFGASKDLISKRLSFNVDSTTSAFASFLFPLPFYFVGLLVAGILGVESFEVGAAFLAIVAARAATDSVAERCKMEAFSRGDISLVAPFLALAPLFMVFLSPIITGDEFRWFGLVGVGLVVGASLLVVPRRSRTESKPGEGTAILIALVGSFFFALNTCLDRLAVQRSSPLMAGFTETLLAALLLAPPVLYSSERRRAIAASWRGFSIRGFFEVLFMFTTLSALQYLPAPHVAGVVRGSVLLSVIGGKIFFREEQLNRRLVAALLVFVGIAVILAGEAGMFQEVPGE